MPRGSIGTGGLPLHAAFVCAMGVIVNPGRDMAGLGKSYISRRRSVTQPGGGTTMEGNSNTYWHLKVCGRIQKPKTLASRNSSHIIVSRPCMRPSTSEPDAVVHWGAGRRHRRS